VLEGFPSVLGVVADLLLERRATAPMRAVFTDGEPLYSFLREKIEKAFETKVYDTYGNTEMCGLIQQCERGRMHLIPECAYLEILDANNNPVSPGEEGDLVWTTLMPRAMPLVRYRIGDRGSWEEGTCECGRAFPLVRPGITRESDLLRCPDGRIFSPRALNQLLKSAVSLRFCQFVQSAPDRVVVRGVASDRTSAPSELADVSNALQQLLGRGMRVSSEMAEHPIMRAGGKMPLIVRYQGTSTASDNRAAA
jgi:phenylacetate-CoA ligase